MGAYHQMGHNSQNLVKEVPGFVGAILSPINYDQADMVDQVQEFAVRPGFDTIFDPQLYFPRSDMGQLRTWPYFPGDNFETADADTKTWWDKLHEDVVAAAMVVEAKGVASPIILPRQFDENYYQRITGRYQDFATRASSAGLNPYQTLLVSPEDLSDYARTMAVASLVTGTKAERVYLVIQSDLAPRFEYTDLEGIKGIMRLIMLLSENRIETTVGFCSSDMVLWKFAGAAHCATGKFWNIRRFNRQRFEEPSDGGTQVGYWFEESLMAFIRQADIARLQKANILSQRSLNSPTCQAILAHMQTNPSKTWPKLGWLQFMDWFQETERLVGAGQYDLNGILDAGEENWEKVEEANILMDEKKNDGRWMRPWRQAILEYTQMP